MKDETNRKQNVTLRVLVADDDTKMRNGTRLMLSMLPNAQVVAMARNGHQAMEMTKAHRPNVALMDINMPGMDGLEAIRVMHPISNAMLSSARRRGSCSASGPKLRTSFTAVWSAIVGSKYRRGVEWGQRSSPPVFSG